MGLIRCEGSPRAQCPNLSSCYRIERGTFGGKGGVGGDLSREVISPCIRAQFKQTSVGALTVRGRNALPVCATLPSDLWLDCHRLTYDATFTPCV